MSNGRTSDVYAWLLIVAIEIATASAFNSVIFSSVALYGGVDFAVVLNLAFTALFSLIPLIATLTLTLYRVPLRDVVDASILIYAVITTMMLYILNIWNDFVKITGFIILMVGMYFRYIPLAIAGLSPILFTILATDPPMVIILSVAPLTLWIIWRYVYRVVFDIGSLFVASTVLLFYYSLDQKYWLVYAIILSWSIVNKMFPNILEFRENLKYSVLGIRKELNIWIMTVHAVLSSITAIKEGMLFRVAYEVLVYIIYRSIYNDSESKNTKFLNSITVVQNRKTVYSTLTST